jgi:magnesium transporter
LLDIVETYRELASGLLDVYLSSLSNRMNEVMKVLTIFAAIFIPLTFVAGLYGMNFEWMPELAWKWAYPAALAVMAALAVVMLVFFRSKGWIGGARERQR